MVSVIIIQYNNSRLTKTAIETFIEFHKENFEILLADNGSTEDGSTDFASQYHDIKLIRSEKNLGFGAMNNLAAQNASGDILLFLNNDVIIESEFIKNVMSEFTKNPATGIIGPKILNTDKTLQLSHGKLPSITTEITDKFIYSMADNRNGFILNYINKKHLKKTETEWVTGAALFIRKDLFTEMGGFDESFFMYFEDKDLCARSLMRGYKNIYLPSSELIHIRGGSFDGPAREFLNRKYRESQIYYYKKHKSVLQQILLKIYLKISGK